MKPKLLSVIIPVYNEQKQIKDTLKKIKKYLNKKNINYELIIVDDGSRDGTYNILERVKGINLLKNTLNKGKGYSVKKGILNSRGDYALFTDADLSTPINELDKFLKYISDYDIVIGSRNMLTSKLVRKQPLWRVLPGKAFSIISRVIIPNIKDTQCGFKLFNMKKCRTIFEKQTINGFCFDVELLNIARKHNLKIKELGVRWVNSPESKVSLIKDSFLMFFNLMKIKINDLRGLYD